jgi:hypothetical protein
VHPTPNSVTLAMRPPRALYDTFAELCEGDIAERIATLVAQAATFGNPADFHQGRRPPRSSRHCAPRS